MDDLEQLALSPQVRQTPDNLQMSSFDPRCPLRDDFFLLMLFERLVDEDLQNSRLVCRRWREVSKQIPVRLKGITNEQLVDVGDAFPNVVSVAMPSHDNISAESRLSGHLSRITSLKSLSFGETSLPFVGYSLFWCYSPAELEDLSLAFRCPDWVNDMISSLRHLTNLTKLVLSTTPWRPISVTPFVELEEIRELDVDIRLFADDQGRCTFPSLTNLTRLGLLDDETREEAPLLSFEAVERYASTVETLSLHMGSEERPANFASLTSLTKLKTLELNDCSTCRYDLWKTVTQIQSITRLRTSGRGHTESTVGSYMAMLTGLKALEAPGIIPYDPHYDDDGIYITHKIPQLTELALATDNAIHARQTSCLTALEHLSLRIPFSFSISLDDALIVLPHLKTLSVEYQEKDWVSYDQMSFGSLTISSGALSEMHHLRSLSFDRVVTDERFFREMASKTGLTKLKFVCSERCKYSLRFCQQINLLKDLEELTVTLFKTYKICKVLSEKHLSKLRSLSVGGSGGQVSALRRKFNHSIYPVTVDRTIHPGTAVPLNRVPRFY